MIVHYTIMCILHRCWIARDLGLWERTGKFSEPAACLVLFVYNLKTTNFVNILFLIKYYVMVRGHVLYFIVVRRMSCIHVVLSVAILIEFKTLKK